MNFCNGGKYADDWTILVTGNDIKDLLRAVEEDLRKIYSRTTKWRMKINSEKMEICLFTIESENTGINEFESSL